jgi:hypothetical protein
MEVLFEVSVTGNPEVAVGFTVIDPVSTDWDVGVAKVML